MTNHSDEAPFTTDLDALSRGVPDSQLPPEENPGDKAVRVMRLAVERMSEIAQKLVMIEDAMAKMFPEALQHLPFGEAADLVADMHMVVKDLTDESGIAHKVKGRLNFAKEVTMPAILDAAKAKTVNTDRYRVTKTTKLMASINGEAGVYPDGHEFAGQPLAYQWLRDNDYGMLIKPTVNASSLSAAAKELVENGMELPEEFFKTHSKESISITKKK